MDHIVRLFYVLETEKFEQLIGMFSILGIRVKKILCNSNMTLDEILIHICWRIDIDSTTSSVNLSFKFEMNGQYSEYPVDEEE